MKILPLLIWVVVITIAHMIIWCRKRDKDEDHWNNIEEEDELVLDIRTTVDSVDTYNLQNLEENSQIDKGIPLEPPLKKLKIFDNYNDRIIIDNELLNGRWNWQYYGNAPVIVGEAGELDGGAEAHKLFHVGIDVLRKEKVDHNYLKNGLYAKIREDANKQYYKPLEMGEVEKALKDLHKQRRM